MYSFLRSHFKRHIADILIICWYVLLILIDTILIVRNLAEGKFRYLGL